MPSSQRPSGSAGTPRDGGPEPPQDIAGLRKGFPGWRIGTIWASAATGPDARRLTATRDGVLLTAWNAAELAQNIRYEERARGS